MLTTLVVSNEKLPTSLGGESMSLKDHPFADGCKRIGATIFLEFLNKNNHLIINDKQVISNSALVAITLMIAESKPEEKEMMVRLVMNFLN